MTTDHLPPIGSLWISVSRPHYTVVITEHKDIYGTLLVVFYRSDNGTIDSSLHETFDYFYVPIEHIGDTNANI